WPLTIIEAPSAGNGQELTAAFDNASRAPTLSDCCCDEVAGNSARLAIAFVAEFANNCDDAFGGAAVPQFGRTGRLPIAVENPAHRFEYTIGIRTNHDVGSVCNGHRAFSIVA